MIAAAAGSRTVLIASAATGVRDRFAEALDRGYGSNIIFSREEAAVIAEARSQQQQRQAMLEAAPDLARAGKDAAQAQQIANEAPAPA